MNNKIQTAIAKLAKKYGTSQESMIRMISDAAKPNDMVMYKVQVITTGETVIMTYNELQQVKELTWLFKLVAIV